MLLVRASFRPYAHEKLKQRVRFQQVFRFELINLFSVKCTLFWSLFFIKFEKKNPYHLFSCVLQIAVLSRVVSLVVDGSGPFLQNVLTHANSTLLPYYGNNFMEII